MSRSIYYDAAAPALSVSAPAGTSAAAPTYVQSDAAMNYTVSGTASDATGIRSVTVNGAAASVSGNNWSRTLSLATNTTHTITVVATDGVGRTTTVNRYLRVDGDRPALVVTAPAGVSAATATWTPNSTYTVSGTVSDGSGIKSVTVNGYAASISGNTWSRAISLNTATVTTVTVVAADKAGRTTTITRFLQQAYTVFSVTANTNEYEQWVDFVWYSGRFSIANNTLTCPAGGTNITVNRTGTLYVYITARNRTGASLNGSVSLYKNNTLIIRKVIEKHATDSLIHTIAVSQGDVLRFRQDGGNAGITILAGSYLRWVG